MRSLEEKTRGGAKVEPNVMGKGIVLSTFRFITSFINPILETFAVLPQQKGTSQ
jgi:hypothetical protein